MGYHFKKSGYTVFKDLMKAVIRDMVSGGFDLIYSNADYSGSEIDLDSIVIKLNGTELTEVTDYTDISEISSDGSVYVTMTTAPSAGDVLIAEFKYRGPTTSVSDVSAVTLGTGVDDTFLSAALPDSRMDFDIATSGSLRVVTASGTTIVPSSHYTFSEYTDTSLLATFTDYSLLPSHTNYDMFADIRVVAPPTRDWNQYYALEDIYSNVNVTFATLPTKTITATFSLNKSDLKTINGNDYTNWTNVAGNEVVDSTSLYYFEGGTSGYVDVGSSLVVSSISTAADFTTVTVAYDATALSDTTYTKLQDISGDASIDMVVFHDAYYYEFGLELDGDKGYRTSFLSPAIKSNDNLISPIDYESPIEVYVTPVGGTATLQTSGVDYNLLVNNENRIEVTFFSTSIPEKDSKVTFNYNYFPINLEKNIPLIGEKDGVNADFEINLKFTGDFYILEAGNEIDPLSTSQPWRISIDAGYEELLPLYRIAHDFNAQSADQVSLSGPATELYELNPYVVDDVGHYNLNLKTVKNYGKIHLGTPVQLKDDGTVTELDMSDIQIGPYGRVYDTYTPGRLWTGVINYSDTTQEYNAPTDEDFVLAHSHAIANSIDINPVRPMSYDLAISDRGFTLVMRADGRDDGKGNFFMGVQRLVDARDGSILTEGQSPVVALYHQEYLDTGDTGTANDSTIPLSDSKLRRDTSGDIIEGVTYTLNRRYDINMMIIRESDVLVPAKPMPIYENSPYINGVWNKEKQISINSNEEFLIVIPDGINTHRHLYSNKRMDMIAYCSANIIMEGGIAKVFMHGEPTEREYKAQMSSIGYVEGWRMLQLVNNGGV